MMVKETLLALVDWFVPNQLQTDIGSFWRARIFAITHLLGPCLGVPIVIYLYVADPNRGVPFWTIAICASAFFLLPFGLKLTARLSAVALFSVCNLTFLSVFGSFF